MSTVLSIHRGLGYVVFVLVVVAAVLAFNRAKNGQEFSAGIFSITMILMDIQLTIGLIGYGLDKFWEADAMIAYVHPIVMLAALGVGHAGLGKARKEQMAADAYRTVGRMFAISAVLLTIGIGVASAA